MLDELKEVHQKHGSSEHPFALLETRAVLALYPDCTPVERRAALAPAFAVFNATREARLRVYESVPETLDYIRSRRAAVVAYTEANVYNVVHRLKLLELFARIDKLYAPSGGENLGVILGEPVKRHLPMDKIKLLHSAHRKPSPDALLEICESNGVPRSEALYVGDSLVRDIGMANRAGLRSAWARYGKGSPTLWEKLVRVTHWTDKQVVEEERVRQQFSGARPDFELERLSDISNHVSFGPLTPFDHSLRGTSV